jgi:hypothetical protein
MSNLIAAIKAHIELIKQFVQLYKNLRETIGEKFDSVDDIKAVIESAKEAIALLKEYENIKNETNNK